MWQEVRDGLGNVTRENSRNGDTYQGRWLDRHGERRPASVNRLRGSVSVLTIDSDSQIPPCKLAGQLLGQGDCAGLGSVVVELPTLRSIGDARDRSNVDDVSRL